MYRVNPRQSTSAVTSECGHIVLREATLFPRFSLNASPNSYVTVHRKLTIFLLSPVVCNVTALDVILIHIATMKLPTMFCGING